MQNLTKTKRTFWLVVWICIVAVFYWITARIGFLLALQPGNVTAFWPPSGLALAAVLIGGWPMGIGVFLGSLAANLGTLSGPAALQTSAAIAAGSCLQTWTAAYLVKRFIGKVPTGRLSNVIKFIYLTGVTTLIAPLIGVSSLCQMGFAPWANAFHLMWTWWIGDFVGILLFAPGLILGGLHLRKKPTGEPLVWIITCLMVGLALFTYVLGINEESQKMALRVNADASEMSQVIQVALRNNGQTLLAVQSFFNSSQRIESDEFRSFVKPFLEKSTAIQAIAWAPLVSVTERTSYVQSMRASGLPEFEIFERGPNNQILPAASRSEYFPITFIEPLETYKTSVGFDIGSDASRMNALIEARDTNEPVISTTIQLVQVNGSDHAILIIAPIYQKNAQIDTLMLRRENLIGATYGIFQIDMLVESALANINQHDIDLSIYDVSDGQADLLVFNPSLSGPRALFNGAETNPALLENGTYYSTQFKIYGRTWKIIARPGPMYLASNSPWGAWFRLLIGLTSAVVFLLYMNFRQQSESRLRNAEKEYRTLVEYSPAIVYLDEIGGDWRYISPKIESILGYSPQDFMQNRQLWLNCIYPEDRDSIHQRMQEKHTSGSVIHLEYRMYTRSGQLVWIRDDADVTSDPGGGLLLLRGVMYDITDRKQVELERQTLLEIMQGLASTSDQETFLKLVHQSLSKVLYAENIFVFLYRPRSDEYEIVYHVDRHDITLFEPARLLHGRAAYVFRTGKSMIFTPELFEELRSNGQVDHVVTPVASWMGVPLKIGSKVIGVIAVVDYETTGRYSERDMAFMNSVAAQVALAIERNQNQAALLENAARLNEAQRIAHMGVWELDLRDQTMNWTNEIYRILGIEPQNTTVSYETYLLSIHPDDRIMVDRAYTESLANHTPYEIDHRLLTKTGEVKYVHARCETWYDPTGHPLYSVGTLQDITQARKDTEQIRQFSRIVEQMDDDVMITDVKGKIEYVNPAFERVLGFSRDESIGQTPNILNSGLQPKEFFANLWYTIMRGESFQAEFCNRRKDGKIIYEDKTISPIRDENGLITRFVATGKDITARKREMALQAAQFAITKLLIEAPLLAKDVPGLLKTLVTGLNWEIAELWQTDELTGALVWIAGWKDTPSTHEMLNTVGHNIPFPSCQPLANQVVSDNAPVWIENLSAIYPEQANLGAAIAVPIRSQEKIDGIIALYQMGQLPPEEDLLRTMESIGRQVGLFISRQRAENALAEERNSLVRRVQERTADLSLANAQLGKALRTKDEFLANMSHELRTPLNAILALSESLLEQLRGPLNERQQSSLRNIEASGRHLLALINDILDLSKVEAGRMDLQREEISISETCEASMLFVKELATKKQIQLSLVLNDPQAKVEADPKRLKQMIVNLLSNAVKFTNTGGKVTLEVDIDAEFGVVHIAVKDNGIGMSREGISQLFQPFTQLDSSLSRQHEGTGLGLALVRKLAELHGGSIAVESEVGIGSRFTISLPYRASAEPLKQFGDDASLQKKAGTGPLRSALVVEDSEFAAEQLGRYLGEMNIQASIHTHGDGALEKAISMRPSIIFLDLQMPDQSGWEVLQRLKDGVNTRDIPVIIASVVDDRVKGLAAGAAEYLVKPISRETLRKAIGIVAEAQETSKKALIIAPQNEKSPGAVRILLAEDNEINIMAIGDYLQDKGYNLFIAHNGREAIEQTIHERPDLILMDIQMPEMDGMEAIRRLRAMPESATIPIIALTALAMPGDRERCMEAGANEYLTKPVSLKGLVETIERFLTH